MGVRLFDRHARDISPTVFGDRVLTLGSHLLKEAAHLERDLELHKELGAGKIVVGAGPFPAHLFLGTAIGRLCSKHPRLQVRVIVDQTPRLLGLLRSSEIDVMVADTRVIEDASDLESVTLPVHRGCFFCRAGHPLADQRHVTLKNVLDFPWAKMWTPEEVSKIFRPESGDGKDDLSGFPNGLIECDNLQVLLDVVVASDAVGVTVVPTYRRQIEAGEIVLLPFENPDFRSAYKIVTQRRYSLAPSVRALRNCLVEVAGEHEGSR